MKLLGTAKLYDHIHETGAEVRSYDLNPYGVSAPLFMGPITQALPTGTRDVDGLRIELQTGKVYLLGEGLPFQPKRIGAMGSATLPIATVAIAAWILGTARKRRRG